MPHPEQPVLDEIELLVQWQIDEGIARGDGPAEPGLDLFGALFAGVAEAMGEIAAAFETLPVLRPGVARRRKRSDRDPWRWDRQRHNTSWKASGR